MTFKQFYEVDEDGFIVEIYALDTSSSDFKCPDNYFEGWGSNDSFYIPKWDFVNKRWIEGKKNIDLLLIHKENKLRELNQKCEESILGRFTVVINGVQYQFSNDNEAQKNFDKADRAFTKGMIIEIPWTVYNSNGQVVRVLLNQETFDMVYADHLSHIQNNISKFRDILQPQVEMATTISEVEAIIW